MSERIRQLPGEGRYTISLEELGQTARGSEVARHSALRRLREQGRIVSPRRGFYVVVPPEYASTGSPPASWFIDDLMGFLGRPYYVGLLSAAAIHGAAHQQPQVFQVITTQATAAMTAGRVRLEFFRKRSLQDASSTSVNTETGTMRVATPATTVFDLIRHAPSCGYLSNVATVVHELADRMAPEDLREAAERAHVTEIQRAGYLFELLGREKLAQLMEEALDGRRVRIASLRTGVAVNDAHMSERWRLRLNERVEPDL